MVLFFFCLLLFSIKCFCGSDWVLKPTVDDEGVEEEDTLGVLKALIGAVAELWLSCG